MQSIVATCRRAPAKVLRVANCLALACVIGAFTPSGLAQLAKPAPTGGFANTSRVGRVYFSPDGKTLAAEDDSGSATFWDVASGSVLSRTSPTPRVHLKMFSVDSQKMLLEEQGNETWVVWDIAAGKGPKLRTGVGTDFTPDGRLFIGRQGGLSISELSRPFDLASAGKPFRIGETASHHHVDITPDGQFLAVAMETSGVNAGSISVWDVAARKTIASWPAGFCRLVQLSPNGRRLAVTYDNVKLFDVTSGKEIGTLELESGHPLQWVMFSPDGQKLIGKLATTLRVWDAATGRKLGDLPNSGNVYFGVSPESGFARPVVFSADSKSVTCVCHDTITRDPKAKQFAVRRWDIATFKLAAGYPIPASMKPGGPPALTSDARVLALSGLGEGVVYVWEIGAPDTAVKTLQVPLRTAKPSVAPTAGFQTIPPGFTVESRGTKIFLRDSAGKLSPMPDGDYVLPNGFPMHIRGGEKVAFSPALDPSTMTLPKKKQ